MDTVSTLVDKAEISLFRKLQVHGRVAFLPFAAITRKSLFPKAFVSAPETLGEHIRACRLSRGLTQSATAKGLNVSAATLLNWEQGKTQPADASLPAIAAFLGYDPFPPATSLPERLQAVRRHHGWSVAEAAQQLAVDEGTWRAWEAGETILFRRHREQVARLLDLPLAALHEEMTVRWRRTHPM